MIALIRGELVFKSPIHIIVDVQGVGYQVFVPLSTFYGLPDLRRPVSLHTHLQVSDDAMKLYGFLTEEEQQLFQTLISISKVGPKTALAILSGISIQDFASAVSGNDIARLSTVPGVGRKTAERVILEMRDKLAQIGTPGPASAGVPGDALFNDALSALINLGYKKSEAEKALQAARKSIGAAAPLGELIKESLKHLA